MSTKVRPPLLPTNLLLRALDDEDMLTCRTDQLKDIIQDLYELMVQTTSYGNVGQGVSSKDVLQNTVLVTSSFHPTSLLRSTKSLANTPQRPPPRIAHPASCLRLITVCDTYPRPTRANPVRRRRS